MDGSRDPTCGLHFVCRRRTEWSSLICVTSTIKTEAVSAAVRAPQAVRVSRGAFQFGRWSVVVCLDLVVVYHVVQDFGMCQNFKSSLKCTVRGLSFSTYALRGRGVSKI